MIFQEILISYLFYSIIIIFIPHFMNIEQYR